MLSTSGEDIASGPVWMEYISFLKAALVGNQLLVLTSLLGEAEVLCSISFLNCVETWRTVPKKRGELGFDNSNVDYDIDDDGSLSESGRLKVL